MSTQDMPYDKDGNITLDSTAKALVRLIHPFYKGFPNARTQKPEFRKSLTGQETYDLLMTLHIIITSILLQEEDEANGNQ